MPDTPRPGWAVPRCWEGQKVVIVAGGPSVTASQVRQIVRAKADGRIGLLAINDAGYLFWGVADWLHASDERWWKAHRAAFDFPGIKTTFMQPQHWSIQRLGYRRQEPLETEPGWIATGINGGAAAINIALQAGASEAVLVGYDMKPAKKGQPHWFGEHDFADTQPEVYGAWMKAFHAMPEILARLGMKVTNATPGSALGVFPRANLEDCL